MMWSPFRRRTVSAFCACATPAVAAPSSSGSTVSARRTRGSGSPVAQGATDGGGKVAPPVEGSGNGGPELVAGVGLHDVALPSAASPPSPGITERRERCRAGALAPSAARLGPRLEELRRALRVGAVGNAVAVVGLRAHVVGEMAVARRRKDVARARAGPEVGAPPGRSLGVD